VVSIDPAAFEPEGEEHQDRERYKIGGPSEADWALRKLAQARKAIQDNFDLARAEIDRITAWHEHVNKPHERDVEYFEAILRNWHDEQVIANPDNAEAWKKEKNKTISLPAGKLSVAKNPDSVVIDEERFIPWALANKPEWVRTEYEVVKSDVKKAGGVDEATGEIAPGVSVVPGELRWKAVTE
jgi:Bacteriophage Mu Gam like protein